MSRQARKALIIGRFLDWELELEQIEFEPFHGKRGWAKKEMVADDFMARLHELDEEWARRVREKREKWNSTLRFCRRCRRLWLAGQVEAAQAAGKVLRYVARLTRTTVILPEHAGQLKRPKERGTGAWWTACLVVLLLHSFTAASFHCRRLVASVADCAPRITAVIGLREVGAGQPPAALLSSFSTDAVSSWPPDGMLRTTDPQSPLGQLAGTDNVILIESNLFKTGQVPAPFTPNADAQKQRGRLNPANRLSL